MGIAWQIAKDCFELHGTLCRELATPGHSRQGKDGVVDLCAEDSHELFSHQSGRLATAGWMKEMGGFPEIGNHMEQVEDKEPTCPASYCFPCLSPSLSLRARRVAPEAVGHREVPDDICRACGGALRIIACIEDPVLIEKILTRLHKRETSAQASPWPPCRAPPGGALFP